MADEILPPAILELIVQATEWVTQLTEAEVPLNDLRSAMSLATDQAKLFSSTLDAASVEAASGLDELGVASAQLSAMLDEATVQADAMAYSQREVVIANEEAVASANELAAMLDRLAIAADDAAAAQEKQGVSSRESKAANDESAAGLGALGMAGQLAVAAVVAVGVAGVKMAADFQTATVRLQTSAGETAAGVKQVQDGILSLSGQVGVSSMELANAMYYVESAGFHAAQGGLDVLTAAAQGAKAEGADTTVVVKALTDVLKDYHLQASDAATVTSQMIAAVAHGKTNLQDFSKAFASIIPAASAAGISFNDAASALAEMTNHGFTAQRASMDLAQALRSLLNPTKPMLAAFQNFGVSTDTLKAKLSGPNGLTDAMQYLSQAATKAGKEGTPEFAAALKQLMGTAPGANAALTTVGANFKDTTDTIKAMASATTDSKGQVKGFAEVQENFGQTMSRVKDAATALATKIGLELLPAVTKGAGGLATFLSDLTGGIGKAGSAVGSFLSKIDFSKVTGDITAFANLLKDKVFPIIQDVAKVLGPVIAAAIGGFIVAFRAAVAVVNALLTPVRDLFDFMGNNSKVFSIIVGAILGLVIAIRAWAVVQAILNAVLDANPITLLVMAVIGLAMAAVEVVKHWSTISAFFKQLWGDVVKIFDDVVGWIGDRIESIVKFFTVTLPTNITNAISSLAGILRRGWDGMINDIGSWLSRMLGDIGNFFTGTLPHAFDSFISWVGDIGKNIVEGIWHGFESMGSWIWNNIVGWLKSFIPGPILQFFGISSPSKYMAEKIGVPLAQGIGVGILSGMTHVESAISTVKKTIASADYGSPQLSISPLGVNGFGYGALSTGSLAAGGGGGNVIINNNIQGTVVGETQVTDMLRTQILRYNQRNPTNGLSLFGRGRST